MDSLNPKLHVGSRCWISGFGGVRLDRIALWPARICEQDEGGPGVQRASKGKQLILCKSYGDDAYVWVKPDAVRPFEGVEKALEKASGNLTWGVSVVDAIRAALPTPATPKPAATPKPIAKSDSGLSAYELQRLDTMRENQRVLESLGVASASESIRLLSRSPEKPTMDPEVRAARALERQERLREAQANRRQSSRLQEIPDETRARRYIDEYADVEEAEREAKRAAKLARRTADTGRGRKARAVAASAGLSAEERQAVADAYDDAKGWLDDMRRYFANKLSDANLRSVMRKVTALATGEGVLHTNDIDVFRRGEPVTLDEDMGALRAAANRFLPPEQDPGHGWRLDHPIGKMAIFQAHLHQTRA